MVQVIEKIYRTALVCFFNDNIVSSVSASNVSHTKVRCDWVFPSFSFQCTTFIMLDYCHSDIDCCKNEVINQMFILNLEIIRKKCKYNNIYFVIRPYSRRPIAIGIFRCICPR